LYDAAVTLIADQGFSATTVDQIVERAGVAKGTFYYNFAGKTELFEELLREGMGGLAGSLRGAADAVLARGGTATDALDAMARAGLDFVRGHPDVVRLCVAEQWRTGRSWHGTLADARRRTAGVVEDVLAEGVKSGELRADLDVEVTAGTVVGMVVSGALDWRSFHPARPLDEVHAALSGVLRGRLGGERVDDGTRDGAGRAAGAGTAPGLAGAAG
jgi:AcrR family transcriptional regulator